MPGGRSSCRQTRPWPPSQSVFRPRSAGGAPVHCPRPEGTVRDLLPAWNGQPKFTEHSYRGFAADGRAGSLILFQNIGYTHAEWAFRDGDGRWAAKGQFAWPWGAEYDKPQPIRVCYPDVAVRGRAVHFCGVSDIEEPYAKWRDYKRKLTGKKWDYDFRRLFYTWTDDITTGKFQPWVEIASRDKTCGWITPGDLWLAPDGNVHILWTERAIDERLRTEFFPGQKQSTTLLYAILRAGRIIHQRTLLKAEEGGEAEVPGRGRFHVLPDGRLLAFYYVQGKDASGKTVSENRLVELHPDGTCGSKVRVPLKHPFQEYFTATDPRRRIAIGCAGHSWSSGRGIQHHELRPHPIAVTSTLAGNAFRHEFVIRLPLTR